MMDVSVIAGVHRIAATFRQTTQTALPVEESSNPTNDSVIADVNRIAEGFIVLVDGKYVRNKGTKR